MALPHFARYAGALRATLVALLLLVAKVKPTADPDLNSIQDEIAKADGLGGYYATTYRTFESLYWQHMPAWMREDAKERKVSRVLDIGCGYGTLLTLASKIYSSQGYCMDVTDYLKPAIAERHGLLFARGNIELAAIPWADKFDVVILTEVLEHFNFQPLPTLRKIHDALSERGVLFLSTPDERDWGRLYTYYRRLSDLPMPDPSHPVHDAHIWIYSKSEVTNLLQQAGFEIVRLSYARGNGNRHFNIQAIRR
jgi:SAM-dependent methyltransferase